MDESPTYRINPAIILSLLAAALSGCAYFTEINDDNPANCPTAELPKGHQPLDFTARQHLEQLVNRDTNANKAAADNTRWVRLNEQGAPLPPQQAKYDSAPWARDYSTVPWTCIKDDRTGLTWEVKTNDNSLRDKHWTYTWYEPAQVGKHGYAGKANGGKCFEGNACDTQAYIKAVNATKLCGYDDWRLPDIVELRTLPNRNDNCPGTCIDQHYFPNAAKGAYWSSSPFEEFICYAWGLDFELADASGAHKNTPLFIRLVHGKWPDVSNNPENTDVRKK